MQPLKFKEIISRAADKEGINEDILHSMSAFVFRETKEEMGRFNNLSIHFKGFFTWFYGRKRLIELLRKINAYLHLIESGEDMTKTLRKSFIGRMNLEELLDLKRKVEDRLAQYERYVEEKKTIRHANNL